MKADYLQLIPILTLAIYFLYVTYYCAVPMFILKILLFTAHMKYRNADIRFSDGKITVKYEKCGEEQVIERRLEIDPASRFFAMNVCSEFRGILKEMRTGVKSAADDQS